MCLGASAAQQTIDSVVPPELGKRERTAGKAEPGKRGQPAKQESSSRLKAERRSRRGRQKAEDARDEAPKAEDARDKTAKRLKDARNEKAEPGRISRQSY